MGELRKSIPCLQNYSPLSFPFQAIDTENDKEERKFTIIHKSQISTILPFSPFHFLAH